jgi:hypothetical protein
MAQISATADTLRLWNREQGIRLEHGAPQALIDSLGDDVHYGALNVWQWAHQETGRSGPWCAWVPAGGARHAAGSLGQRRWAGPPAEGHCQRAQRQQVQRLDRREGVQLQAGAVFGQRALVCWGRDRCRAFHTGLGP